MYVRNYGLNSPLALALAVARNGKLRGPIPVAPVRPASRIAPDATGFRPLQYETLPDGAGTVDLVAEAEARRFRGGAALLNDVLHEDLDDDTDVEETIPAGFPTPGLGSQNADPVAAAEYIARLHATHAPGGTQNR